MFFDAVNRLVAVGFPMDTAITVALSLLHDGNLMDYVEKREKEFKEKMDNYILEVLD